tara:strand:+ start:144 stop:542 length:399 start_codon:yes stop_codon:yes gene_type:complete
MFPVELVLESSLISDFSGYPAIQYEPLNLIPSPALAVSVELSTLLSALQLLVLTKKLEELTQDEPLNSKPCPVEGELMLVSVKPARVPLELTGTHALPSQERLSPLLGDPALTSVKELSGLVVVSVVVDLFH